jgi:hypothetical protein
MALAFGAVIALGAREARADMLPPPDTSGCATQDAGSACILANGGPGVCRADVDSRRNRRFTRCEAIPECDVVPVGGACHGFGDRPAHCREIVDDQTHRPFRMCVADPTSYEALNDASQASAPTPTPTPTQPTGSASAPMPPMPQVRERSRCSVGLVGHGPSVSAWGALLAGAWVLGRARRREKR